MTSEPGSFARRTITEGKPRNIEAALRDNDYPQEIVAALHALRRELASEPIRPPDPTAPGADFWHAQWARYRGRTWLEVPWYFAEAYFYRRLLETVGYFRPGPWQGRDPFAAQKERMLEEAIAPLAEALTALEGRAEDEIAAALIHGCLWGNRADLSNWGMGLSGDTPGQALLIDHTPRLVALLRKNHPAVHIIADNAGLELLFDLALIHFLLSRGWAQQITLHLKADPFFVSDALPRDVHHTLARLSREKGERTSHLYTLAARLQQALNERRFILSAHPFWNSCLTFHDMPPDVRASLAQADLEPIRKTVRDMFKGKRRRCLRLPLDFSDRFLVLLKGDANYRRLLGDRHWPPTTRLEKAAAYFPRPFAVLRTMKSELIVGLEPGRAEALNAEDPQWMVNGKRGIIQVVLMSSDNQNR